eukprot:g53076.t1
MTPAASSSPSREVLRHVAAEENDQIKDVPDSLKDLLKRTCSVLSICHSHSFTNEPPFTVINHFHNTYTLLQSRRFALLLVTIVKSLAWSSTLPILLVTAMVCNVEA